MNTNFHPSFIDFLKYADYVDKYKSNYSCYGFYHDLKLRFNSLEENILNLYTTIRQNDKTYFIEAHIKKIKSVSSQYIAIYNGPAINFLEERNCTIIDIFEKQLLSHNLSKKSFPYYFKYTYDVLFENGIDEEGLNLHSAFISLISDHFIEKILGVFNNFNLGNNKIKYNKQRTTPQLNFKELFKPEYQQKTDELKKILKTKGYIDEKYKWVGLAKETKELAILYHVLNDKEDILVSGKFEPQIKTFYKEFGLKVTEKKENESYCTVRNLKDYNTNSETYLSFNSILKDWFNKE